MQEIGLAWVAKNLYDSLILCWFSNRDSPIIVVFLWIGIFATKNQFFCFLSDDLYKERNTIIIWIAIIFIFFWWGFGRGKKILYFLGLLF